MQSPSRHQTGKSLACQFNQMVIRKLQKALQADPEVDLLSQIPSSYSTRLADRKSKNDHKIGPISTRQEVDSSQRPDDVRHFLQGNESATVLFPLSESVRSLIASDDDESSLAHSARRLVEQSKIIWKPKFGTHKIVLKFSPSIALKIILNMDDFTEYTALQYLEEHKPNIPSPRPLGLIRLGKCFLIFMTFVPVQAQLNDIFVDLRSLTRPDETPLGGVAGEGCQDLRRHVRRTRDPIWTTEEFDNWQFSNPHFGSPIYIETLRRLSPPLSRKHVFSHNDLRPENIIVKLEEGQCFVAGIIDWQYSGFYPEYYESTKVMNGLSTNEDSDWYLFIPEVISPLQNAQKWLLDALWWKHVE
ncbi:hypothetical protein IQ07DRAFT_299677 [Pyrenochaeta sp. DS3sAY3a]|nr:hypothetical protein IQ07DRAFT_299677 [Pyrenochaeta sp. DS3sAY3a]